VGAALQPLHSPFGFAQDRSLVSHQIEGVVEDTGVPHFYGQSQMDSGKEGKEKTEFDSTLSPSNDAMEEDPPLKALPIFPKSPEIPMRVMRERKRAQMEEEKRKRVTLALEADLARKAHTSASMEVLQRELIGLKQMEERLKDVLQKKLFSEDQLELVRSMMLEMDGMLLQKRKEGGDRWNKVKRRVNEGMQLLRLKMVSYMTETTQSTFEALEDVRNMLIAQILADEEAIQLELERMDVEMGNIAQPLHLLFQMTHMSNPYSNPVTMPMPNISSSGTTDPDLHRSPDDQVYSLEASHAHSLPIQNPSHIATLLNFAPKVPSDQVIAHSTIETSIPFAPSSLPSLGHTSTSSAISSSMDTSQIPLEENRIVQSKEGDERMEEEPKQKSGSETVDISSQSTQNISSPTERPSINALETIEKEDMATNRDEKEISEQISFLANLGSYSSLSEPSTQQSHETAPESLGEPTKADEPSIKVETDENLKIVSHSETTMPQDISVPENKSHTMDIDIWPQESGEESEFGEEQSNQIENPFSASPPSPTSSSSIVIQTSQYDPSISDNLNTMEVDQEEKRDHQEEESIPLDSSLQLHQNGSNGISREPQSNKNPESTILAPSETTGSTTRRFVLKLSTASPSTFKPLVQDTHMNNVNSEEMAASISYQNPTSEEDKGSEMNFPLAPPPSLQTSSNSLQSMSSMSSQHFLSESNMAVTPSPDRAQLHQSSDLSSPTRSFRLIASSKPRSDDLNLSTASEPQHSSTGAEKDI
jgi:hypothetical protein